MKKLTKKYNSSQLTKNPEFFPIEGKIEFKEVIEAGLFSVLNCDALTI